MLNLFRLALIGLLFVVFAVSQAEAFGGRGQVVQRQRIVTRSQPVRQRVVVQQVVAQPYYQQAVVQQQVVQRVYAQPVVQQRVIAQPYCAPSAGLQLQQNSCNQFFAP